MSSSARLKRLEDWLHDVAKIETENFSVSVEIGKATAEFFETNQFSVEGSPLDADAIKWQTVLDDFSMQDSYHLELVIRNQLIKDFTMLKVKLLLWLSKENQVVEINYDCSRNNQDSYDYFFTLKIVEWSHSDDCGEVKTC